ncbi:MAG: DUF1289 domain-containing protein [Cellvibrio sp.]|uniref:DUF1289 domain-containing protein n=1 Tax=Cellvibrio sp. TaxID=1965322 RepID=UPI0031A2833E
MALPVESPCVRNCCLNEADVCVGCFRTLHDITRWSVVSDATKLEILHSAAERREQAQKSRSLHQK